jgi:hypothetical protein
MLLKTPLTWWSLTIDRVDHFGDDEEFERRTRFRALDIAKRHLDGLLSENTKVLLLKTLCLK